MNTLLNIDCMQYMKTCSDNQFDLAIVDPPYGIGVKSWDFTKPNRPELTKRIKEGYTKYEHKSWDTIKPSPQYWKELLRISKNQIIWGANHFSDNLPVSRGWIYWEKGEDYKRSTNFSHGELAYTSFDMRLLSYSISPKAETNGGKLRIHPTQKPIALYKWLLTNYAKPNDKLLDTHSGSGSFRIAAHDLGFDLISCELDSDYYRDNNARYQNHIKQGELFPPEEIQKNIYVQPELI